MTSRGQGRSGEVATSPIDKPLCRQPMDKTTGSVNRRISMNINSDKGRGRTASTVLSRILLILLATCFTFGGSLIFAQTPTPCGFDVDGDDDIDDDDVLSRIEVEFFVNGTGTENLPAFLAGAGTECEDDTVRLRLYLGEDTDSATTVPFDDDNDRYDLGAANTTADDDRESSITMAGENETGRITLDQPVLSLDSNAEAWGAAPIVYTLRAFKVFTFDPAEQIGDGLEFSVVLYGEALAAPDANTIMAAAESPSDIYVEWTGDGSAGDATFYEVAWRESGTDEFSLSGHLREDPDATGDVQHYTISGLVPVAATGEGKSYDIKVRAILRGQNYDENTNPYDVRRSPYSEFATAVTTKSLGDDMDDSDNCPVMPIRVSEGHTQDYGLACWITPSALRDTTTTYSVRTTSGNTNVFTVQHITDNDGDLSDDLIRITGVSEGKSVSLNIEVTATLGSGADSVVNVLTASGIKVDVTENAAPMFTITSATVDWNVETVGTDFEINVVSQFVNQDIDDDIEEFSMTGGSYNNREYLEINEDTGQISVPSAVTSSQLESLPDNHQFELVVTATDQNDQSDSMTIYVDIVDGREGGVTRKANSDDEVWLRPIASDNGGGTQSTDVTKSFEIDTGHLCFSIVDEGFTVDGSDANDTVTLSNDNEVNVDQVATFRLSGAASCKRGRLSVTMELPSTDPASDQFELLGHYGTIQLWFEVDAQRGNDSSTKTGDPVKIRVDFIYGQNSEPRIRSTAKVTGRNVYVTSGSHTIDEGEDIELTFTADDGGPTDDRLCWSQMGNCKPCHGPEDTEVYRSNKGVIVERRASHDVSNNGVSHSYELLVRGEDADYHGPGIPRVNTDFETNPGGYEIELCATDLAGETHEIKFTVRIENVDEAPTFKKIDNLYFLVGDYPTEIDLNDYVIDGDGNSDIDDFTADIIGSSDVITVSESNGIVTVTPTEDDIDGPETVTVEVSATDLSGQTAYAEFDVTVKQTNRSPRWVGGLSGLSFEIEENSPVNTNVGTPVEATDSDSGDTISYELSGSSYFKVVEVADGAQIQVAKKGLDYEGDQNSFDLVLTASDNYGGVAALSVEVDLIDVNEPPMRTPDEIEDQTVLVGVTDCVVKASEHFTDPDSDSVNTSLVFEATSTRPGEVGVEVQNNEDICIIGNSVSSSNARITITATDFDDNTVLKRFLARTSQNHAPTIVGDGIPDMEIQEDGRSDDIDLLLYFDDGDAGYEEELVFGLRVKDSSVVTAIIVDDHFLRIYGDADGETEITINATDQNNQTVSSSFTVEVIRNDPPIAHADSIADVSTRVGLTVDPIDASGAFTDEGDTFTLSVSTDDPEVATAGIKYDEDDIPWILVYIHSEGVTKATLKATDTADNTAQVSFTIDVGARNDPPKLVNEIEDVTLEVDDKTDIELDDVFEDEGTLTFEIDNEDEDVADVIYRENQNVLRIFANALGTTDVKVTAIDNVDQTASDEFVVTVTEAAATNQAPNTVTTLSDFTLYTDATGSVSIDGLFEDPDGDELTYEIENSDSKIVTATLDELIVNLTPGSVGTAKITVIAKDPMNFGAITHFMVMVEAPPNAAPIVLASIEDQLVTVGTPIDFSIEGVFEDPDGDDLTYAVSSSDPTVAIADLDSMTIMITGKAPGTTVVRLDATDPKGLVTSEEFIITVDTVPVVVAQIDDVTMQIGGEIFELNVAQYFNDEDGDTLTYTFASEGKAATMKFMQADLSLTPSIVGSTEITVKATDPRGRSAQQTFSAMVSDSEIRKQTETALASVGRHMISSSANAIGARVEGTRENFGFERIVEAIDRNERKAQEREPVKERQVEQTDRVATNPSQTPETKPEPSVPAEPKVEPVANQQTSKGGISWGVISSRGAKLDVKDFVPRNFSQSLEGDGMLSDISVWGTTDEQTSSSADTKTTSKSAHLGTDVAINDQLTVGISVSKHESESEYSWGTANRQLVTDTTSVLPYASYRINSRTLVWGVIGRGSGDAIVRNGDETIDKGDLTTTLAILSARSDWWQRGSLNLGFRGDAAIANLSTDDGVGEAKGLDSSVSRYRLGMDVSYDFLTIAGIFAPFGELAYRSDGGDGITGNGFEIIGGLRYSSNWFTVDARGHSLITYSENDYEDKGFSMLAVFHPSQDERGLMVSVAPTWGQVSPTFGTLLQESATLNALIGSSSSDSQQLGMALNTSMSYGFYIKEDTHMVRPYLEYTRDQFDSYSFLLGAEIKQLISSTFNFDMDVVFGKGMQTSDSGNTFGLNARLRF
ncbi:MAG: hypothetical protein F4039_02995 [Gammaproteobacteria bacterium]|nr:hypothetical protein [Gammaproteobacteria bacterium]